MSSYTFYFFIKNQILAQSATAMLAQASAISQNILPLLR
ncbi:MAG: flagellin [Candidatus Poribacteria bacterium]|nr:flagellin [Candidatus Poribacteria bacterium]